MHELLTRLLAEARGTWRFRWYGLVVAWFVAVAGCLLVYSMPDQFQASARVHVDTDSILQPLLKGLTVHPDMDTKVRLITNTLLSRPNLQKIARRTDLSLQAKTPDQEEALLDRLRHDIDLSRSGRDLYTISYINAAPREAQNVVQTVLNILMETTIGATREDSASARKFLEQQVKEYEGRLQSAEQRLAAFKRKNLGMMPDQGGRDYYARLSGAQQTLQNLQDQLQTAQSQRQAMQKEIAAMKNGKMPTSVPNPRVTSLDAQIQSNSQQLNDLLLKYTDQHPDVIALKDRIARLRKERDKAAAAPAAPGSVDLTTNPVYQKLQMDLNTVNVQVQTLQTKIADQQRQITDLKSQVDAITEVETQLKNLTRNYDVTKQRYQELLTRLNTAELSRDAEHSGKQIQFQIIDPPVLPAAPMGPNRPLYVLVVLVAALGAGLAFAFFLHQVRPVFMNRRVLAEVTGRPVLGSVSMAFSAVQRRWLWSELTGFAVATGVLLVFLIAGLAFATPGAHLLQSWIGGGLL